MSIPLVILAAEAGFRATDPRYEQAAAALGAKPWYALRHVVLPMVAPQIAAGAVLAWARALGEFGATITFAGNLAGRTQTLPLAVFQRLQTDPEGADRALARPRRRLHRGARRAARPMADGRRDRMTLRVAGSRAAR